MKKIYSLLAFLMVAMCMVACNDKPLPEPTPEPGGDGDAVKPEISIEQVSVSEDSFTFKLTSSVPGDYAYYCVDTYDNNPRPAMPEWFNENSGKVEDTVDVTVENLKADVSYELFVVVRATEGQMYSDVKKMDFTTKKSSNSGPITLISAQHDRFAFKVNIEGYYRYCAKSKTEMESLGLSLEAWIAEAGGVANGVQEFEYINGETGPDNTKIVVMPGAAHVIGVWPCDAYGNVYGDYSTLEFETPEAPESTANVKITLSNITGTTVDVKCEPDASIVKYHILIQPKSTIDTIVNNPQYGEKALIGLMGGNYAWTLTNAYEGTWTNLMPDTEYCVCCLLTDNEGAQKFTYEQTFTTTNGSGMGVVFEVTLTPTAGATHSKVDINITAENIVSMRYCFNDSAAIKERRDMGIDDSALITYFGEDVTPEQLTQAHNGTLTITKEDLWPEAEYTVLVYAVSNEQLKAYKTATATTEAQPIPARVESSLFESLQGEWNMSYTVQYFDEVQTISNHKVTISQGVDDKSTTDYRNQNRLVITDWAFQTSVDIPTMLPQDLMDSHTSWRDNPSLAYRDYGPKTFLEIGEGDVITMPTSRAMRFYGWQENGDIFYFFGFASDYGSAAPCAFPVELSADGNTLTIKPFVDSAGTFLIPGAVYYPAVARDTVWSTALTDIVLTRVK